MSNTFAVLEDEVADATVSTTSKKPTLAATVQPKQGDRPVSQQRGRGQGRPQQSLNIFYTFFLYTL